MHQLQEQLEAATVAKAQLAREVSLRAKCVYYSHTKPLELGHVNLTIIPPTKLAIAHEYMH